MSLAEAAASLTPRPGDNAPPVISVAGLKTYFFTRQGIVKAVDDVSFAVKRGETLAIVGESGCGKSITALSLMRLIPDPPGRIVAGAITLDGKDLMALDEDAMRGIRGKDVSMIFQEPMTSLNPVMTIGRQIGEVLKLHQKLSHAEIETRVVDLLNLVRIPEARQRLDEYPHQLSGGMRQRIMIAMALACQPKLIIADEPTTALDVTVQAQILELLKELTRETGAALILITHDLGVVARYADRVNVMYAGRIVESATADEIYAAPRHPYTIGLLRSVPRLDQPISEKLLPIEGQPPNPLDLPSGCAFHPRCPYAIDKCRVEAPPLTRGADGRAVACWVNVHG